MKANLVYMFRKFYYLIDIAVCALMLLVGQLESHLCHYTYQKFIVDWLTGLTWSNSKNGPVKQTPSIN